MSSSGVQVAGMAGYEARGPPDGYICSMYRGHPGNTILILRRQESWDGNHMH